MSCGDGGRTQLGQDDQGRVETALGRHVHQITLLLLLLLLRGRHFLEFPSEGRVEAGKSGEEGPRRRRVLAGEIASVPLDSKDPRHEGAEEKSRRISFLKKTF